VKKLRKKQLYVVKRQAVQSGEAMVLRGFYDQIVEIFDKYGFLGVF